MVTCTTCTPSLLPNLLASLHLQALSLIITTNLLIDPISLDYKLYSLAVLPSLSILGIHKEAISDQGCSQLAMTVQDGYVEGGHAILKKVRENKENTMYAQSSQHRLTRNLKIYEENL